MLFCAGVLVNFANPRAVGKRVCVVLAAGRVSTSSSGGSTCEVDRISFKKDSEL